MPPKDPTFSDDEASSGRGDSAQPEDIHGRGSSSSARKAQNRIAQREFRLRKQQYIRDLEAKVQMLEGDKEERVELMTLLVRNLMKENKDLRHMLRLTASFIGEGLGSCLPRLGLSADQLDAILNRADTDTVYEAFINLKASRELEMSNPGIKLGEPRRRAGNLPPKRKRTEDEGGTPIGPAETPEDGASSAGKEKGKTSQNSDISNSKRIKSVFDQPIPSDEYTYLFPDLDSMLMASESFDDPSISRFDINGQMGQSRVPNELPRVDYGQQQRLMSSNTGNVRFPSYNGSTALAGDPLAANLAVSNSSSANYPPSNPSMPSCVTPVRPVAPLVNEGNQSTRRSSTSNEPSTQSDSIRRLAAEHRGAFDGPGMTSQEIEERRKAEDSLIKSIEEGDTPDRKLEAMQLITYHLNNFRMNHEYHLPPSLRPTVVQRTVPHEHAIDGICFPSLRDRMILLRGRYDLVEVFHSLLAEFTLHGDDVLDHRSYEVSEKFIHDYSILVDDSIVAISNKWRALRGEPPIQWPLKDQGQNQLILSGATSQ
ncbi:hypothetical protein CNBC5960 [Cryptococcus deneoformans B-3501A]|uniref:Expressed protein n=1 Tax=Cryptococcus deneoformans (strain JEC21 / ATCC MYA-565) TaxID=214684 RepID=Q5KKZ6_CRYD1|nr:expressed protein [Cryptococcus neoformans var. neoformans JEC21]XP_776380.1 hypothetical protein CNBC5960 [Cryptococcus neoformans var. neoformans B-3501A]AAW42655.1 expressed protein [Cryptococcus neoformans var. neoformans JEC21]EAL21733.1 hypothetical protein CNBC5960 [Cryptococcus neoformans var. neoformans B-3501A]